MDYKIMIHDHMGSQTKQTPTKLVIRAGHLRKAESKEHKV